MADGAQVVICDVLDDLGVSVAQSLGDAARYLHLDVTSEDDWRAVVETTCSTFGNPSILVSNAGIMMSGPLAKTNPTTSAVLSK